MADTRIETRNGREDRPIYARMMEWAVWATDRDVIPERCDSLSGDYRISEMEAFHLAEIRQCEFTVRIEAVEKAVATLKDDEPGDDELHRLLLQYFLEWKSIERIAIANDISSFRAAGVLQRALRLLAIRLPVVEKRISTDGRVRT